MPFRSMTGFARTEGKHAYTSWVWELRSVNGRGLDMRFRLPFGYESLEPWLRAACADVLARGSFTAVLSVTGESAAGAFRLNEDALRQVAAAAARARQIVETAGAVSLEAMFGIKGVLEMQEVQETKEAAAARTQALLSNFKDALADLDAARAAEGARLESFVAAKLEEIAALVKEAEASESRRPERIQARLREDVQRLLGASRELEPDRLHQEAVLIAAKADIEEELKRLRAHLEAVRELFSADQPVGRKLEFLVQEFHREANTLCSKSNAIDITRIGLRMKAAIDQLREQAQNIE